jgi:regulator of protease activity HflC (stomatin/prohibitin superfamily)
MAVNVGVKIAIGGAVVFVVLLVCILIPVSIKDVQQDEYAIEYHDLLKQVTSEEIHEEGRFLRAPAVIMIPYKRTAQTLDFTDDHSVECLSKEGLNMDLDVSVQYQIIKENVRDVFSELGLEIDWQKYLRSVVAATVMDACAKYTGDQFYSNRDLIEVDIEEMIVDSFVRAKTYCTMSRLQVRNVNHPAAYAASNQKKQEVESEKARVESARVQLITDKETELLVAEANAGIALTRAKGTANAVLAEATILANAEVRKWSERGLAFSLVKSQLGDISNAEFIAQYLRYITLIEAKSPLIALPTNSNI